LLPRNKAIPKNARRALPRRAQIHILSEIMRPPTRSEKRSAPKPDGKTPARVHQLSTFLLGAAFALALVKLFVPMETGWPEAVLVLLAVVSTLTALARQLPLQNVLLAACGIALIGGGISALDATISIPFGPLTFGLEAGPKMFKILPWAIPFLWIIVVLNSRGVARLILRPWRKTKIYGFWLIGVTAALTMLFDLALDPFAWFIRHYWFWTPTKFPVTWQGAPLVNFLGWGVVALLMLAFVTPALIRKQPGQKSGPAFHPLAVWLGAMLFFGIASAQQGLWLVVGADGVIGLVTAIFAIRGARW
jgi:putative membrane protein